MLRFADYTCPKCGHTIEDVAIESSEETKVNCDVCETSMTKMIGGLSVHTKSRTERVYPPHLLNGGERARFGK